MTRYTSWPRFAGVLLALLLVEACRDPSNPDATQLSSPSLAAAADPIRISGIGTIGTDPKVPGNDVRDFDLDVSSTLSGGRLLYRDFFVVRPDGSVGKLAVSPTDTATRITAFRDGSSSCTDPTKGAEFDGVGRLNTGGDSNPAGDELLAFTVKACDGGPAGSGMDYFAMIVPGHDYARGDVPTSGDVVKSGSAPPPPPPPPPPPTNQPPTVNAGPDETALIGPLYSLNATFGDPDNDGPWSYTIDWGDGSSSNGSTAAQGTITASHTYLFSLLTSRTIRVTVTDSHGASGSDTKVVRIIL